jgi:spore maturation protein CgeB
LKILVVNAKKLKTVPMGGYAIRALKKLGHQVFQFDLSDKFFDKCNDRLFSHVAHDSLNKRFQKYICEIEPDFVLTIFGFDLSLQSLSLLKNRNIVSACWWINDPFQFKRSLQKASHYDFLFTNALDSVNDYRSLGVNAFWLPTACDPDVHKKGQLVSDYKSDLVFAGDWSPLREKWCESIAREFDLKIFGPWKKKISKQSILHDHLIDGFFTPEQMVNFFSSSKVVFNIHSWYGQWNHGTNPRLFESAGSGVCQLVDYKNEIPLLFDDQKELFTYSNEETLKEYLRYLLGNSSVRKDVAHAAQARAYQCHTYIKRMETLLKIVGAC